MNPNKRKKALPYVQILNPVTKLRLQNLKEKMRKFMPDLGEQAVSEFCDRNEK